MSAGTTNRKRSLEMKFMRKLPARMPIGVVIPTIPETLPRPATGTWSGRVAFAAARRAFMAV
ncbi:hypothetical protein GCM10025864_08380 [Luteimicrobium album]|uniref:Uncharacterized protein n=1 Tax=Luteimicrobium album TaxID=1054550 RepID=A0ABQ6HX41_9MICO|nr:hypothetical protein GCM10025864_08380 [Luteimicrobium album]